MQKLSTTDIDKAFRESGLNDKQINKASTSFLATYGNHPTKEALESFIEGYLFNLRMMGMISDNATVEAETTKEVDENSNRKEHDVIVVTHPDVMKNIDGSTYSTYAGLKAISHFEGLTLEEYNNYIQKRGAQKVLLDFMEEASKEFDGKVPAPSTVKKHIKKLIDNKIPLVKVENYEGKVYYKLLNSIDNKWYVRIPYEKVRELVISTNSNMMKLYAIMCYATNETEYKPITRSWLAEKMGLSTISENNLTSIGIMLTSLCNLGFLECLEEVSISPDGNEYKTIHKYRITTLNEYREAKRRGKHRKIVK